MMYYYKLNCPAAYKVIKMTSTLTSYNIKHINVSIIVLYNACMSCHGRGPHKMGLRAAIGRTLRNYDINQML